MSHEKQRVYSIDQQRDGGPGISHIRDQAFKMSAHRLKIQIEDLQKYFSFGAERVVKACAPDTHRTKQFRHVGPFDAPLPKCLQRFLQNIVSINLLVSHISFYTIW